MPTENSSDFKLYPVEAAENPPKPAAYSDAEACAIADLSKNTLYKVRVICRERGLLQKDHHIGEDLMLLILDAKRRHENGVRKWTDAIDKAIAVRETLRRIEKIATTYGTSGELVEKILSGYSEGYGDALDSALNTVGGYFGKNKLGDIQKFWNAMTDVALRAAAFDIAYENGLINTQ